MTVSTSAPEADETRIHESEAGGDAFERIAEEFIEGFRRGESPSISDYERRYPEYARRIRDLLPSVAMMERLKRKVRASREDASSVHEPMLESLGEYRIIRELGRGGMGIVYEAYQESLSRHVALKVIPRQGLLDAKRRQRFQREALAVAQLHHTNIVPIFAVGEQDGLPYYAMQYIRGRGLDRLLESWRSEAPRRGPEHWRFVARVGIQAAEALQYAHDQGVLHRDVKPANLLLDEHEVAWVTDFGLAKLAGRDDLTNSGDVVGTLRYLAPEALQGRSDHRGDIYSLGLTLYELLTLRQPFGDLSPSELLRCVTEEQPIRPRRLDRSIPLDLETIILKATAREPSHRYATAGALAADLRAFLEDRPIRARRASVPDRLGRWCRRNRVLAGVSAFAAFMFLAALVVGWAGYVSTTRALQRAIWNEELSLHEFQNVFESLMGPEDSGPFADDASPPVPPGGEARMAPPPEGRPNGRPGSRPSSQPGMGPPPGAGGMLPQFATRSGERDVAVLETVLEFYDRFAERNETNTRLQGEAAKAYRKVAAIYRWMRRDEEAESAWNKSLARLRALVAQNPASPDYRYELARTVALDDQFGVDESSPKRSEAGLREGIVLVETLAATYPDKATYKAALARWNGRLARVLENLGRNQEAEACYRAAIARDEWLADRIPDNSMVHWILATNRDALAKMLIEDGRGEQARAELNRAAIDLGAVDRAGRPLREKGNPLADQYRSLARSFRQIGDKALAVELEERAADVSRRAGRDRGPGPRPRDGFGPPPDGRRRRGGEGE